MDINLKKISLFWGFVLFLLEIASATPNTKICRKRNGNFPMPGSFCKGYYVCKNFVPVEKMCDDGEHFNANKERCDWEDLYPCLEKRKDKECLKENGLFLKSGTECKKYYRCCNGKAKEETCPGDTLFDPSKRNCEWPDLYTCIESLTTTEKISSTVTSFATSTPPDDQKEKTETDPVVSTVTSIQITYSTQDPDFERTNSRISEITDEIVTQPTPTDDLSTSQTSETPTPTDDLSTSQTSETPTISQTITIPTTPSTIEISTSESTTIESTTIQSTTKISTLKSTTTEISTSESIIETSTLITTSSEIISQTISPQMSSTQSTSQTFSKENKEGDITEPTLFETTTELTFSPSTEEVTPFDEQDIKCPEPNGHFPHPMDKHKFIVCSHNRPSVFTCPSNLVYKQHLKRCEYEKKILL